MDNMLKMTKQQAIKAAYGELYDPKTINNEGWQKYPYHEPVYDKDKFESKQEGQYFCIRPKSLSGIETNNSWTRIESEEDLPKDDYFGDLFEVGFLDESGFFHHDKKRCSFKSLKWMYEKKLITHYQLVEKPKPPIF
ncbi:hypothetical protein CMU30_13895 [Elizabethkingia anophelis]|nr:hypothetical protein [Elizabethkingia anophelis]MDV3684371.1 hypothetical protein [Elizabethkingia anophelis]MDV3699714.1 hypothetical protein [Elizabethkingia anophelis]MDV3763633.1 hypothetical protein [Elizabethkingia anophelis]MDV3802632.1 hypothetical protein [Elizabethkingia anophelis]